MRRRVQGEVDISDEELAMTMGGVMVQRRRARVNPSMTAKGSSDCNEMGGTDGRESTAS